MSEEVKTKETKKNSEPNMLEPKTPAAQETKSVREIDEQTQKHIDRFREGKDVWNQWANEMLAKKAELEKNGKWRVKESFDVQGSIRIISSDMSNPEIQNWLDEAYVDFSTLIIYKTPNSGLQAVEQVNLEKISFLTELNYLNDDTIDFKSFIFPDEVNFRETEFLVRANFSKSKFIKAVSFLRAKFRDEVNFSEARFQDWASFWHADFNREANFSKATFKKWCNFRQSVFKADSTFGEVEFEREVSFWKAKFKGMISFREAEFKRWISFREVEFHEKANFRQIDFERHVNYEDAKFVKFADFEAIKVKRAFNLARTEFNSNIPNFTQANFAESPRLDNIEVIPSPKHKNLNLSSKKSLGKYNWQKYFWLKKIVPYLKCIVLRAVNRASPTTYSTIIYFAKCISHIWNKFFNTRRNSDEEAHYRALKRLAILAHDHENEMKFFAGEIRARRHITDFANFFTHDFASSTRYWAGVAYELFSDFGRSFIRPTIWWFACLWLFANLTLSNAGLQDEIKCHNSQLTPKEAAYTIGLKNSLLILGLTKTNIVKQAELCLYGLNKNGVAENKPKTYNPKIKRTYQTKSTKADIPFKAAVQGIIHSLLSLLFIFLLLLAIRNQFKIK